MSRRSVWFSVLRRHEAVTPASSARLGREAASVPALLRGRWRVHEDDDRHGDTYSLAARAQSGPYIEVTE